MEQMDASLTEEEKAIGAQFLADASVEDKLAAVIRAHIYMESTLNLLVEECLLEPSALDIDRLNFSTKVDLLVALGALHQDLKKPLEMVNRFRNRFAHNINAHLTELDERQFFNSFSKPNRDSIQGGHELLNSSAYLYGALHAQLKVIRSAKLSKKG
jgi:hypothetical protein